MRLSFSNTAAKICATTSVLIQNAMFLNVKNGGLGTKLSLHQNVIINMVIQKCCTK